VGQPSMPEIRESTQLPYRKLATSSSQVWAHGVVGKIGYLRSTGVRNCLRQHSAITALPAAIATTVPHAVAPIIASIVVAGLVGIIGKYLLFYARNRRARSIAEIRRAAIAGKIAVSDAEKLIRADMQAKTDPQQPEENPGTGEGPDTGNDDEGASRPEAPTGRFPVVVDANQDRRDGTQAIS